MCNSIFLDDKTLSKAKDGEEVEVMVKATYHTDDQGVRKLDVMQVDGNDVVEDDSGEDCGCSGGMTKDQKYNDLMGQDSGDALRIFLIKSNKK